jgi:hypothetical protein
VTLALPSRPSLDCPTFKRNGYVQRDDDSTIICSR